MQENAVHAKGALPPQSLCKKAYCFSLLVCNASMFGAWDLLAVLNQPVTLELINREGGAYLHRFAWIKDDNLIGMSSTKEWQKDTCFNPSFVCFMVWVLLVWSKMLPANRLGWMNYLLYLQTTNAVRFNNKRGLHRENLLYVKHVECLIRMLWWEVRGAPPWILRCVFLTWNKGYNGFRTRW